MNISLQKLSLQIQLNRRFYETADNNFMRQPTTESIASKTIASNSVELPLFELYFAKGGTKINPVVVDVR